MISRNGHAHYEWVYGRSVSICHMSMSDPDEVFFELACILALVFFSLPVFDIYYINI